MKTIPYPNDVWGDKENKEIYMKRYIKSEKARLKREQKKMFEMTEHFSEVINVDK